MQSKRPAVIGVAAAVVASVGVIFGIDVSHYQSPSEVTANVGFVIAKSSQGATFRDPDYSRFKDAARKRGAPFAAYHYLMHGNIDAQARNAFRVVGSVVPLAVDCEWSGKCTFGDLTSFVKTYRSLGGKVTLLYVPRAYWVEIGKPNLARVSGVQLWNARYTTYSNSAAAWDSYGGLRVIIWQYSDGKGKLDHDAYRGTRSGLCTVLYCWPVTPTVRPLPRPTLTVAPSACRPRTVAVTKTRTVVRVKTRKVTRTVYRTKYRRV